MGKTAIASCAGQDCDARELCRRYVLRLHDRDSVAGTGAVAPIVWMSFDIEHRDDGDMPCHHFVEYRASAPRRVKAPQYDG